MRCAASRDSSARSCAAAKTRKRSARSSISVPEPRDDGEPGGARDLGGAAEHAVRAEQAYLLRGVHEIGREDAAEQAAERAGDQHREQRDERAPDRGRGLEVGRRTGW